MGTDLSTRELARLPFLPDAVKVLRERGLSIDLKDLESQDHEAIVNLAIQRVENAVLRGGRGGGGDTDAMPEALILSFVIASIIAKLTGNKFVVRRFALSEAKRVENYLSKAGSTGIVKLLFEKLAGVKLEDVEMELGEHVYCFRLSIKDYVRMASNMDPSDWGLANQLVSGGYVYITYDQSVRLLRDVVARTIEELIDRAIVKGAPRRLTEAAKRLLDSLEGMGVRTGERITTSGGVRNPPCIKEILRRVEKSENIPHFARFLLATYMLAVGSSVDEVVQVFSRLPDFNERITRYQVEHISGKRGSGKKYSVPSCSKVQSMGFCFMDQTCKGVKSPAHYAFKNSFKRVKRDAGAGRDGGKAKARSRRTRIPEDEV